MAERTPRTGIETSSTRTVGACQRRRSWKHKSSACMARGWCIMFVFFTFLLTLYYLSCYKNNEVSFRLLHVTSHILEAGIYLNFYRFPFQTNRTRFIGYSRLCQNVIRLEQNKWIFTTRAPPLVDSESCFRFFGNETQDEKKQK